MSVKYIISMSFLTVRRAALTAMFIGVTMTAYAGGGTHDYDEASEPAGRSCGTERMRRLDPRILLENTARQSPELYRRLLADRKMQNRDAALAAADTWEFLVVNNVTMQYDLVTATRVWEGATARIWVDDTDRNNAARNKAIMDMMPAMQRAIDSATAATSRNPAQGIIINDIEVFGPTPTTYAAQWQGKTNILLTDIKDPAGSGNTVGFFAPVDQYDEVGSNQMNLLYLDSKEGLSSGFASLASTIAHEFQHLIHFGQNSSSEIVYDEGCSEVASLLNGYRDRTNAAFLANTNVDLFRWSYDDGNLVEADYQRGMNLIHFLYEQYGENMLRQFTKSQQFGMNRLNDALKKIGATDDWMATMKNFAVANYLQTFPSDRRYGYLSRLSNATARISKTFTGAKVPADTSIAVEPYASVYINFAAPKGLLNLKFAGSSSFSKFAVMAIVYQGSTVTVTELEKGKQYTLGENGFADRVVLAYVNLTNSRQQIATTASVGASLSVAGNQTAVAGLALLGATPSPVTTSAQLRFTTPTPAPVTLAVYDARGTVVRTLIDGERFEVGEHSITFNTDGLPNGLYVARLWQGGDEVSQSIVVVKP